MEVINIKRERIRLNHPNQYGTGDAQDWTYEYTWEDYEAAIATRNPEPGSNLHRLVLEIEDYFFYHPEKLMEGGTFKERGYTAEQIKKRLSSPIVLDLEENPTPRNYVTLKFWGKEMSEEEKKKAMENFVKTKRL